MDVVPLAGGPCRAVHGHRFHFAFSPRALSRAHKYHLHDQYFFRVTLILLHGKCLFRSAGICSGRQQHLQPARPPRPDVISNQIRSRAWKRQNSFGSAWSIGPYHRKYKPSQNKVLNAPSHQGKHRLIVLVGITYTGCTPLPPYSKNNPAVPLCTPTDASWNGVLPS